MERGQQVACGRLPLCGLASAPLGSGTQSSAWTISAESFHACLPHMSGSPRDMSAPGLGALVEVWWVLPLPLAGGHWPTSKFLRTGKDQVGRTCEELLVRVESQTP